MWRTINYLTRSQTTQNLQKIDIPEDYFIKWNHINSHKGFKLKTIDDTELIDTYITIYIMFTGLPFHRTTQITDRER